MTIPMHMVYYHLRYNIYPLPGMPVEKEVWKALPQQVDESVIKTMLQEKHHTVVSIIHCALISDEAFFEQMEKQTKQNTALLN